MDYNCHNAAAVSLQYVFKVTFVSENITTESVMPVFDRLIHVALLEFSICLTSATRPHPRVVHGTQAPVSHPVDVIHKI